MLQHSSYISLWHIVLHLTIILATHEAGSLISRIFFIERYKHIINGNLRSNLYYSETWE